MKTLPFRPARKLPFPLADGARASRYDVRVTFGEFAATHQVACYPVRVFPVIARTPGEAADHIEDLFDLRSIPCVELEVKGPKGGIPVKRYWGFETAIGNQMFSARRISQLELF